MDTNLLVIIIGAVVLVAYCSFSYVRYRKKVNEYRKKIDEEERRRKELGLGPKQ